MPAADEGTFVLFDVGHDESMLRLGDLVLYDYKNPLNVSHYTCQKSPYEVVVRTESRILIS